MARPSRRKILEKVSADGSTHAGLWFDAMLAELPEKRTEAQGGDRDEADASIYRDHLEALASRGVPPGYREAAEAREALLRSWTGTIDGAVTRVYEASAEGRMVVGLGAASLTETHIALQRTWGVPFLPGSALKGLASSTAHRSGDADWLRAETHTPGGRHARVLFGDTTTAGVVTFHDAWWVPGGETKLPLDLDVMTVHHADYYMKGDVPADWDSPNPVAFVTARGTYLVALTGPEDWVETASVWLKVGLARDGLGAKTHAGYGRMRLTPKLSPEEQQASRAAESLEGIERRYQGRGTRQQVLEALRTAQRLGADRLKLEAACQAVYARDAAAWKDWLKDPARTPEERALFASVTAPAVAPPDRPAPAPSAAPTAAEAAPWLPGHGWITREKHTVLRVRLGNGKPLERKTKDVTFQGDIQTALQAASEGSPLAIEVQLKGEGKVQAVRAAHAHG